MSTGTMAVVLSIGGVTIQKTITETGDHPNVYGDGNTSIVLPAAKAVTQWVEDSGTVTCTLPANHGYSDGKFDVYWTGGRRYNADGEILTDALTLTGGTGDDFPIAGCATAVVTPQTEINTEIDGDEIQLLGINSSVRAHLLFCEDDDTPVASVDLVGDQPVTYAKSSGAESPLAGEPIGVCYASNGSTTAGLLVILSLEDATPE